MNFKKSSLIAAAGFAALFAGCSTTDDTKSPSQAQDEDKVSFEVAACEEITDKDVLKDMEDAQETFIEFIDAFGVSDFERAQKSASTIKDVYGKALKSNPGNCEAQLGYALATITDLLNNKALSDVIDTINAITRDPESDEEIELPEVVALHKLGASEASKLIVKASTVAKNENQKVITDRLQDAIADELIPAVDTAIIFLNSIAKNADFKMSFTFDDETVEIDQSVTAPALGGVYALRAVLTALASFNIDFSKDGKYDWIDSLMQLNESNYKENVGAQYIVELLSRENPFGTVKKEWKDRYLNIPKDLQNAITNVNGGFMYKLDVVEKGISQKNALYVVGKGEDADISVEDLEAVMDSLEKYKEALGGKTIYIDIDKNTSIAVNLAKFFEVTSDIKSYAPYYKTVQPEDWFKSEYAVWGDNFENSGAEQYAETEIERAIANNDGALYNSVYFFHEGDDLMLSVSTEYSNGYSDATYRALLDGCEIYFDEVDPFIYESYDEDSDFVPAKYDFGEVVVLPEDKCKVEDEEYKFSDRSNAPNVINLTDEKGKTTLSYAQIASGNYTVEELKKYVVFPDYTFGGMLPEMTKDKFWDLMELLYGYDEDNAEEFDD